MYIHHGVGRGGLNCHAVENVGVEIHDCDVAAQRCTACMLSRLWLNGRNRWSSDNSRGSHCGRHVRSIIAAQPDLLQEMVSCRTFTLVRHPMRRKDSGWAGKQDVRTCPGEGEGIIDRCEDVLCDGEYVPYSGYQQTPSIIETHFIRIPRFMSLKSSSTIIPPGAKVFYLGALQWPGPNLEEILPSSKPGSTGP